MKSNQPPNQLPYLLSIPKISDCFFNTKNKTCLYRMNNSFNFQRITEFYYLLTIDAQNYFIQIPSHNQGNIRIIKLNVVTSRIIIKQITEKDRQIQFIFLDLYNHIKLFQLELQQTENQSNNLINQEIIEVCNIPDAFYQLISNQIFIDILLQQSQILTLFTKNSIYFYDLVTQKYYKDSFPAFDIKHKVSQFNNCLLYVHNSQIVINDPKIKQTLILKYIQESIELVIQSQIQVQTQHHKPDILNVLTNKSFYQYQLINTDKERFFHLIEKIPFKQSIVGTSCLQLKKTNDEQFAVSIASLNQNIIKIHSIQIPTDDNSQFLIQELYTLSNIRLVLELQFVENKLRLIHLIDTQVFVEFYDYNTNL